MIFRDRALIALPALLALSALPATAVWSPAAAAEPAPTAGCSERNMMVGHLNDKYGETLRGAGLRGDNGVMELYVSEEGSWTLLLTLPDGNSCPVAVGDDWRMDKPMEPGSPV